MVQPKVVIFGGYLFRFVSFKMPIELPQSETCGKSYHRFTETVQDGSKTDTLVFKPHFGNPILGIMFCVLSESFRRLLIFTYWGFKSPFDV